jgi:bifunctional DNA-binding transcriptional regulator/antitoxin component of YhaV-PrlF toxin-antitoxin module
MPNGKINAMMLRMDKSGRIVSPKPLRRRLGLKDNMELEDERPSIQDIMIVAIWSSSRTTMVQSGVPSSLELSRNE